MKRRVGPAAVRDACRSSAATSAASRPTARRSTSPPTRASSTPSTPMTARSGGTPMLIGVPMKGGNVALANGVVYYADDRAARAWDAATGEELWTSPLHPGASIGSGDRRRRPPRRRQPLRQDRRLPLEEPAHEARATRCWPSALVGALATAVPALADAPGPACRTTSSSPAPTASATTASRRPSPRSSGWPPRRRPFTVEVTDDAAAASRPTTYRRVDGIILVNTTGLGGEVLAAERRAAGRLHRLLRVRRGARRRPRRRRLRRRMAGVRRAARVVRLRLPPAPLTRGTRQPRSAATPSTRR